MKKILHYCLMLMFCLLSACSRNEKNTKDTITVAAKSFENTLYYSGIIQPKHTIVVTSPADGVIVDMPFQYGENIKAGKLLFKISSAKFLADYKAALLQYIKVKSEFNNAQTILNEGEFLHKNQLISDDDYKSKQSTFFASRLALLQAKDTLENLLKQLNVNGVDLFRLAISDVNKINEAMHLKIDSENLQIVSPASGIILSPNKTDEETKKIVKGDTVKLGDVLAVIGDLNGLAVKIKVNELTVNQLHVGQKVTVTGIAFPSEELHGEVTRVDRQGEIENNGLPIFPVEIIVPTLTSSQQQIIHVGMSAKIEIKVDELPQISIPFTAIKENNGTILVKKFNHHLKQFAEVEIKTGKTSIDQVTVLSGLKPGDKIAATY